MQKSVHTIHARRSIDYLRIIICTLSVQTIQTFSFTDQWFKPINLKFMSFTSLNSL